MHLCTSFHGWGPASPRERWLAHSNCDVNELTDAKTEAAKRDSDSGDSREERCPRAEGVANLVEVVEGGPELLHLLLADALGIAGEDLVLNLVDGAGDGGQQLLPAHANVLG